MPLIRRMVYFTGIFVWVGYVALFPVWAGRSYDRRGRRTGMFGLRDDNHAPLWSPPAPSSDSIDASLIWPWQAPYEIYHVEIHVAYSLAKMTFGIIALGLIFGLVAWLRPVEEKDPIVRIGWTVSLSLAVGWIFIIILAMLSMGFAVTDPVLISILTVTIIMGIMVGLYFQIR